MSPATPIPFCEFNDTLDSAWQRSRVRSGGIINLVAGGSVFLFGYGGKGRALAGHIAKNFRTTVIVYDSSDQGRTAAKKDGFSVVANIDEVRGSAHGIILGACQAQLEQAELAKERYIYYEEAAFIFDAPLLAHRTQQYPEWVISNKSRLYDLYTLLHPDSRPALIAVLKFRLSLDPRDLTAQRRPNSDMWFDVIESHQNRLYSTFLDVGAYDGDTLMQARRRLSVSRGIAVEANKSLFESIHEVGLTYDRGVQVVPRAAWSHECRLHFSEVRGGMISVSESPDGELEAGPIDDSIREPVDLIKMDIEGAEIPALSGCRQLLQSTPDLAIAAYHRPDDLFEIPAFLGCVGYTGPEFDVHIAHYSDCLDDTILYFLKRTERGR